MVAAAVLPEVDQLQRRADLVGAGQRVVVAHAVQVQQQPPDRIGRALAVAQQLGAVGVAALVQVLLEGVEQGLEQRQRQVMAAEDRRQRPEHRRPARRGRMAARDAAQILAVGGQIGGALRGRGVALVGQVVGGAREAVDRGDRRAQRRRAQHRGDGKVLVVVDGHAAVCCSLFARARDEEMLIRDSRRRRGADYPREV